MLTDICYVGNEARDSVMTFVNCALRIHNKVVGDILAFSDLPEGDSFKQEFKKRFVKFEEIFGIMRGQSFLFSVTQCKTG